MPLVKAKAKGFYNGPREPGDEFEMALRKDGSVILGSWYDVIVPKAPKKDDEKKPGLTAADFA